jgi:hypothetical protein
MKIALVTSRTVQKKVAISGTANRTSASTANAFAFCGATATARTFSADAVACAIASDTYARVMRGPLKDF